MKKPVLVSLTAVLLFLLTISLFAFDIQEHNGSITAITRTKDRFITAAQDGYIVIWDINQRIPPEYFQLTTYKIEAIVSHPLKEEICIIESGSPGIYGISTWNYSQKRKLFSVYFSDPVTYINYSGSGNYIISAGSGQSSLLLINSQTGEMINNHEIPSDSVAFAATGRGERNMILYKSVSNLETSFNGQILYFDLDTGSCLNQFQAPPDLHNTVLFANNSFLAGINSNGLMIVDAASGEVYDSTVNIDAGALLCSSNDEFYCLSRKNGETALYRFSVNSRGRLNTQQRVPLSFNAGQSVQSRIIEIAAGKRNIALLTENGDLCFIPLDYRLFASNRIQNLTLVKKENYSSITYLSNNTDEDRFILWQSLNTRNAPQLITTGNSESLNSLTGRFPLRSISSMNDKLLVLDTSGNLSVRNINNLSQRADFTFNSAGANDAVFVNDENIIIARSAVNSSPFISVNLRTGETLPVNYNAQAAFAVYHAKSGKLYAEVIERGADRFKTTVIDLLPNRVPVKIFEYPAEANYLSIAESAGRLAVACDNEGAVLYANRTVNFERTKGLPLKLIGCDNFFLSLDSEGNIAWHNNTNGRLLAVFSLYSEKWSLLTDRETTGGLSRD
jgi:outer membrane protein assembly factor BamB